jgi:hypothetical protein
MSHNSTIRVRDQRTLKSIAPLSILLPANATLVPTKSRTHDSTTLALLDRTSARPAAREAATELLPRRIQLTSQPADRVCLHWIHSEGCHFDTFAGRAFESALLEPGFGRRDARQCHPVFAYRTHRPFIHKRSPPLAPKDTHYPAQQCEFDTRNDEG